MPGQIINRGKNVWLVRVFLGRDPQTGKRQYSNETVHGNKKDAEGVLTNKLRDRDTGVLAMGGEKRTVGALLDDLVRDYRINGKDVAWAEMVVERHLRPGFGNIRISKLTTATVQEFIQARQTKGAANATINRSLALLKRAYNLGRECTPPKVTRVPYIPMLKEDNTRKGFLEYEDYLRLREALPAEIRPVLTFAFYTGCRKAEILSLEWGQVDLLERVVRLEPGTTKNEEARVIPLAPELYETLAMQRAARDRECPACPWVFHRDGEKIRSFRKSWDVACMKAGLWIGDDKTGEHTRVFHDLRRSGVRNLIRAGVPERVAMAISGHKTRSVFDRYNIVSERDLKSAAERLGKYIAEKKVDSEILAHNRHTNEQNATKKTVEGNSSKLLN
jgi:integrase